MTRAQQKVFDMLQTGWTLSAPNRDHFAWWTSHMGKCCINANSTVASQTLKSMEKRGLVAFEYGWWVLTPPYRYELLFLLKMAEKAATESKEKE